jgi:hypothetical protein
MSRKKWTPQEEITESLLKFREKRKWQLALRRYVLEKNASASYAYYFGLGIEDFRKWIEVQFIGDISWENFGSVWQFDHVIPLAYFDFSNDDDLQLCWNFINIRVESIEPGSIAGAGRAGLLAARTYFEALYKNTNYTQYKKMLDKIREIERPGAAGNPKIEGFILENKEKLENILTLNKAEFGRLNQGMTIKDIMLEREIINKFG